MNLTDGERRKQLIQQEDGLISMIYRRVLNSSDPDEMALFEANAKGIPYKTRLELLLDGRENLLAQLDGRDLLEIKDNVELLKDRLKRVRIEFDMGI